MILDRIELFVNVAKYHSLTKTARGMHVSPSSVSQRLKSLENDFGVKLYKRNKTGIELTDAGRTVLSTVSQVLDQLDTLRKTLNPQLQTPVKTLTIGANHNPSAGDVPSAIAAFQKIYSDIKVTFRTSSARAVEKWVRDGEVDVALIQNPSQSCIADLYTEEFATDSLALFTSPAYPLTKKQRLSLADLAKLPLVVREGSGMTQKVLGLLRSHGLTPNVAVRCATRVAVRAAVRKKMGVGILFHSHLEEDIKRKGVKVLKIAGLPKLIGHSYIVYQKDNSLTAPANKFLALLRDMKARLKGSAKPT
jgi:DNA-binding transcriptional LysR family regulator